MIEAILNLVALLVALAILAVRGIGGAAFEAAIERLIIAMAALVAIALPGDMPTIQDPTPTPIVTVTPAPTSVATVVPTPTPIPTPIVPSPDQGLDYDDWNDTVKSGRGEDVALSLFHVTNEAIVNPCCGSGVYTEFFTGHWTCDPVDHPWAPSNCPAPTYPGYDDTYWPPSGGNLTYSITAWKSNEPVKFTVPAGKNWNTVKVRMLAGPRPEVINVYVRSGGFVTYTVLPWTGANNFGWVDVTITLTIKDTISMLEFRPLDNSTHRWVADDILFTNMVVPEDSEPRQGPPQPPPHPPNQPPTPREPPPRPQSDASA